MCSKIVLKKAQVVLVFSTFGEICWSSVGLFWDMAFGSRCYVFEKNPKGVSSLHDWDNANFHHDSSMSPPIKMPGGCDRDKNRRGSFGQLVIQVALPEAKFVSVCGGFVRTQTASTLHPRDPGGLDAWFTKEGSPGNPRPKSIHF